MRSILETIRERVLLGDGALGTYFYDKGIALGTNTDLLNLQEPELVLSAHQEYIRAGSQVIETNTFGANRFKLAAQPISQNEIKEINLQGALLAKKAAGNTVYVAGSIGPSGLYPLTGDNITADDVSLSFQEHASPLLEAEVDLLILETFSYLEELLTAIHACRRLAPDIPIIAQMVFPAKGLTVDGRDALSCADSAIDAGANVFGSNCGRGVKAMLAAFEKLAALKDQVPLSAFPNAGLPEVVGDRTVYSAQPAYMAAGLSEMIKLGARLVGGCCGTTPAHIHEFKQVLRLKKRFAARGAIESKASLERPGERPETAQKGAFLEGLQDTALPVIVELDPPVHLNIGTIIEGAKALKECGASAISLAEHPLAILRADNLSLAHIIKEEVGIETILHLTCRDRNVLGLQAQIMAAHFLGINAILAITGDPASASDQPGVTGVFDLDSIGLVRTISRFNAGFNLAGRSMQGRTHISIGVAFSYRPSNPTMQLRKLEKKAAAGAHFVMTQPMFDPDHIEKTMELTQKLGLMIFPGIFPLISARNAEFLHNEVPGISVPAHIRKRLWEFDKAADQRKAAMEITQKLISEIKEFVHGMYVISPLNKWEVAKALVEFIRTS